MVPEDRAWFSAVPITNPRRTLNDCAREGLSPGLLRQAAQQALRRGLVTKAEFGDVASVSGGKRSLTDDARGILYSTLWARLRLGTFPWSS
jgi:hypothetical protein